MERINHPTTGETGYFCTSQMKTMIDAILCNYYDGNSQIQEETSSDARGVEL